MYAVQRHGIFAPCDKSRQSNCRNTGLTFALLWTGENEMELRKARKGTYSRIRTLYLEAFPPAEQAAFHQLIRKAELRRADMWNLYETDEWVGMAYVLHHNGLAYIFYLAIDKAQRGKGYGTRAVDAIRRQYEGCRIFLSLETPDESADNARQRANRHAFYANCGFQDLPNRVKEGPVIFSLMGTGGSVQAEEYRRLIDHTLGPTYRQKVGLGFVKEPIGAV